MQPSQDPQEYRHIGYVLPDATALGAVVAPFLRSALSAGEPVVIACPDEVAATLAAELGSTDDVSVVSAEPLEQRPPIALAAMSRLIDRDLPGDGRRLHLVTGPSRPDADRSEWTQTEWGRSARSSSPSSVMVS